ncbi:uncharacterized protein LOC134180264 [Corticium candelabrum]|uniref:uncharacterized protein LOC134180264 n=1 Tax=Corticium candelabrum TaxID=121492 RepID=UPI002E257A44|nr:uncharacterized protein LOC134180264 [Corticium candelabrum]
MEVQRFRLPLSDTRLLMVGRKIYKIKLRQRGCEDSDEGELNALYDRPEVQQDLKNVILYTLVNIADRVRPVQTNDLVCYPFKSPWMAAKKLNFYQHNQLLDTYPEVITFYVECKDRTNLNKDNLVEQRATDLEREEHDVHQSLECLEGEENERVTKKQLKRKQLRELKSEDDSSVHVSRRSSKRRKVYCESEDSESNSEHSGSRKARASHRTVLKEKRLNKIQRKANWARSDAPTPAAAAQASSVGCEGQTSKQDKGDSAGTDTTRRLSGFTGLLQRLLKPLRIW